MDDIHIVGAGGIGCAVGYALRSACVPVRFVESNPLKIASGRAGDLCVDDRPRMPAEFVHFDEWQPRPGSWVLLCTKCYDNPALLDRLAALPGPVQLLPIQNGFDPRLREAGHRYEGVASFVSQSPGDRAVCRITRPGDLHLGCTQAGSPLDPTLLELAAALRKSRLFRVKVVPRIEPYKYTKLMYNAAISPIAAAAGLDNGKLLSHPPARKLFFALIQENYRILSAVGIELGKVGPFHPSTVSRILGRKWLARVMAGFFEPSLRGTYCSMAGEIQKGRTEIDNYNGHLIRLAEKSGTPCPLNKAVHELVTRMSRERAAPRERALEELGAAIQRLSSR
jgi:2-dehydropantoate 2-reductase